MKWQKKFEVDIHNIHRKNLEGMSLPEISIECGIPVTTLNRYLKQAGYDILVNRKVITYPYVISRRISKGIDFDFKKSTEPWKNSLVFHYGHKCAVCGYDKIVEAHHIIPMSEGGITSIKNGILLCPNCHAEVHAKLLDLSEALLKLGELLESSLENNQQPSRESMFRKIQRVTEGSTTNARAKAVMATRAPKSRCNRISKEEYFKKRDMI